MGRVYALLADLAPLILAHQGDGTMVAIRPSLPGAWDDRPVPQNLVVGDFVFHVTLKPSPDNKAVVPSGLIIQLGPEEFLVAGTGLDITFSPRGDKGAVAGIDTLAEGWFSGGVWKTTRLLNGDESNQGREIMLPIDGFGMQRITLYRY
jgi:hypothetical protein